MDKVKVLETKLEEITNLFGELKTDMTTPVGEGSLANQIINYQNIIDTTGALVAHPLRKVAFKELYLQMLIALLEMGTNKEPGWKLIVGIAKGVGYKGSFDDLITQSFKIKKDTINEVLKLINENNLEDIFLLDTLQLHWQSNKTDDYFETLVNMYNLLGVSVTQVQEAIRIISRRMSETDADVMELWREDNYLERLSYVYDAVGDVCCDTVGEAINCKERRVVLFGCYISDDIETNEWQAEEVCFVSCEFNGNKKMVLNTKDEVIGCKFKDIEGEDRYGSYAINFFNTVIRDSRVSYTEDVSRHVICAKKCIIKNIVIDNVKITGEYQLMNLENAIFINSKIKCCCRSFSVSIFSSFKNIRFIKAEETKLEDIHLDKIQLDSNTVLANSSVYDPIIYIEQNSTAKDITFENCKITADPNSDYLATQALLIIKASNCEKIKAIDCNPNIFYIESMDGTKKSMNEL